MHTLLALAALMSCVYSAPFEVYLQIPTKIEIGQAVTCGVKIINPTDDDYLLFYHGSPLEKTISDIFVIKTNAEKLDYDGPMFKRAPLNKQSKSILLKSHGSITSSVDLSSVYPVRAKRSYTVYLTSEMHYFKVGGSMLSHGHLQSQPTKFRLVGDQSLSAKKTLGEMHRQERKKSKQGSKRLDKDNSPRSVTLDGSFSSADEVVARRAWTLAYKGILKGQTQGDKIEKQYNYWFGVSLAEAPKHWKKSFAKIQTAMEKTTFNLHFNGRYCKDHDYAYTYYRSDTIFLCDKYSSAPIAGYDSKLGILVNELTRVVMETKDLAYGEFHSRTLAMRKSGKAVTNADNYEYFIESL